MTWDRMVMSALVVALGIWSYWEHSSRIRTEDASAAQLGCEDKGHECWLKFTAAIHDNIVACKRDQQCWAKIMSY